MPEWNQTHELKIWPEFFRALESGAKTFEARKDDRGFLEGDWLLLQEWDPGREKYTGRSIAGKVTYILRGPGFGISEGHVVMALAHVTRRT